MGIGSWFKKWRNRGNEKAVQDAQNEYFDTPEEQRIESGDIEGLQADYRAGMLTREELSGEPDHGSADPEERLAEEEER
jgi:hypothetical protein